MLFRTLYFILMLAPMSAVLGQNSNLQVLLKYVDDKTGSDNLLVNGRLYSPSHPSADGHPYYKDEKWVEGFVYIKGNTYAVKNLKLNIFTNQLVLKHERNSGTVQNIALSHNLVDSFRLNETLFINRKLIDLDLDQEGYLEVIYTSEIQFFRIQQKVLNPRSNVYPYGQFRAMKDLFLLLLEDRNYKITKKKDLLSCFPEKKAEINRYMKGKSMKWKKMTDKQYYELLRYCHEQS